MAMIPVPTKLIAGVTVPDTPLITKALEFARDNTSTLVYNHVVRSWLFGTFIADRIPHLQGRDNELHAVAAILHDLGWSKNTDLVSKDKRFEVDSANATRDFLVREGKKEEWDGRRLQLAWDAVALHTTASIAKHKEIEVQACLFGIGTDFAGLGGSPGGVLTQEVWDGIVKEYPRVGFSNGVKEILCGFCTTKPETTYDTFMADFGAKFVEGYNEEGHRIMDRVLAARD
ncbi:hypothetical protein BKA64DRAFT_689234 [Cadophora sp. MPI-SDFR-AT-0126]|nr:hypothetical protein BKA64DRAFT_689234 [Leotiomycetes sp. MPI-SDFR-AT-0126]